MLQSHKFSRHSFPHPRINARTTNAAREGRQPKPRRAEMLKRIVGITSLALLPFTAGAATLIIPAAGTGPGANGSQWSTELVIHNASSLLADIQLKYHDSTGTSPVRAFVVGARTTVMSPDVVRNIFGKASGTGAVEIDVDDA